jgi:hypothetical protein
MIDNIIPLIYNNIDSSNLKNIILIHDNVKDYKIFFDSSNIDTFPIIYNTNSSKDNLIKILDSKFKNIERIAFIFHNSEINNFEKFLDNEKLFTNNDLEYNIVNYSSNCQFIINLINKFNVKYLDYLVCNTLKYDYWNKYYDIINKNTNVIISASNNKVGNKKYGGNWILESLQKKQNSNLYFTNNIKNIYFTNNINNYQYTLNKSKKITVSTTITQNDINTKYSWPVIIQGGTKEIPIIITFKENLTISGNPNIYFKIKSNYITINGNNNKVTIDGIYDYIGLIQNGNLSNSGFEHITINNISIFSINNSTLQLYEGWLCQSYFGKKTSTINNTININNCYNTCNINNFGGGILGSHIEGYITVNNCYNIGNIGQDSGGICGPYSHVNAKIYVNNCYNIGNIAENGGGIFGSNSNSLIYVNNCYNTGSISTNGGGIFGRYAKSLTHVNNCYNASYIDQNAAGIFGNFSLGITDNSIIDIVWDDDNANKTLNTISSNSVTNPNWIKDGINKNISWLLSSFNDNIYNSNTLTLDYNVSGTSSKGLFNSNYTYSIISPNTELIKIDRNDGTLTFSNKLKSGLYNINVLVGIINNGIYTTYYNNYFYLTVDKIYQTITFSKIKTLKYGEELQLNATSTSELLVLYRSSNTNIAIISGNILKIVNVGNPITITAYQNGDINYNAALSISQDLIINKADQIINFPVIQTKKYSDLTFILNATSSSGLLITYVSSDVNIATISNNIVTIVNVGTTIITASQNGDNNYNPAINVSQNLVIDKGIQKITFDTLQSKKIGDLPFELNAISSSGLSIKYSSSNKNIATISKNIVTIKNIGISIITASQKGNTNYNAALNITQKLNVKKIQIITFNTIPNKIYGDLPFTLNGTSTSGLSVEYLSSDTNIATINGNNVIIHNSGNIIITAYQNGDDNYSSAVNVSQKLIINKQNQTITFNKLQNKNYGDLPFLLNGTSTSQLLVSYKSSNTNIATISDNIVTIVGLGTTTITSYQDGDNNYNSAINVTQNLFIDKGYQIISFNYVLTTRYNNKFYTLSGTTNSGLPISYTSSNTSIGIIFNNNIVKIMGIGSTVITANQSGNLYYYPAQTVYNNLVITL